MSGSTEFLNPSEAARRLGISTKALRVYEQRGLITPIRSAAGWRAYGADEMTRAADIVALRALGFSLAEVARVLKGDLRVLEPALAAHQAVLEGRLRDLGLRWRRFARSGTILVAANRRPWATWRDCWGLRPNSRSPSTFPGRGAASGSSSATSVR